MWTVELHIAGKTAWYLRYQPGCAKPGYQQTTTHDAINKRMYMKPLQHGLDIIENVNTFKMQCTAGIIRLEKP